MRRKLVLASAVIVAGLIAGLNAELPVLAARLLLYPARHHLQRPTPASCNDVTFNGEDVSLKGWRCRAVSTRRATLIYLHGVADNRGSTTGIIERFTQLGFDVIVYDSRAHGESSGDICTYGYFEKQDLHRVIDTVRDTRIVLIGSSMGAAVALQEAADDPRVTAVVAAESFSDLRTVAHERAPFILTERTIQKALEVAEQRGHFKVDEVNVAAAASRIKVPVLVIHGDADRDTPPVHSQRIFDALSGPKRLILVPGAHHNESLNGAAVWKDVERWIDDALQTAAGSTAI